MPNHLLILEGLPFSISSKIQISDFLTFRLGLWKPRVLCIEQREGCDSNLYSWNTWLETRAKNAPISKIDSKDDNLINVLKKIIISENCDTIIYVVPNYSPAKLLDQFWMETGIFLTNRDNLRIQLKDELQSPSKVIGFIINKNLLLRNNFDGFLSIRQKFLFSSSETMPVDAVPGLFNFIEKSEI